jgi:signal transduction histidine kinase
MRLEWKLALLGIGTALLAVILVAVISRRSTVWLVDRRVADDDRRSAVAALADVSQWRSAHASWRGAVPILAATAARTQRELLLLSADGRCVTSAPASLCSADVRLGADGRLSIRSHAGPRTELRVYVGAPKAVLPGDIATAAAWTLFALPTPPAEPVATVPFFDSMRTSLWLGGAIAALVAIVVSLLVARSLVRPVRRLIGVARAMGAGDLSQRVAVSGTSELSQLGAAFNTMAENLARQDRLRRDMLHDVAHELRGPLTAMRCQLEAAQDGLARLDPPAVASLHEDVMLLSRLVDDLRDIALAEAGQLHMTIEPCDLNATARHVVEAMSPAAEARGVALTLEGSAPVAHADAGRVAQILANLVSNATRHSPPSGTVRMHLAGENGWAVIDVADDGPGIAPEHLPLVFDRFFRTDASRTRESGGVGLGLAIVKQLTELQGGSVVAHSANGSGSRFTVRLRAAEGPR